MDVDHSDNMMTDVADNVGVDATTASRRQEAQKTLPWIEKYRPSSLHDLISHDEIVRTCTFDYCSTVDGLHSWPV